MFLSIILMRPWCLASCDPHSLTPKTSMIWLNDIVSVLSIASRKVSLPFEQLQTMQPAYILPPQKTLSLSEMPPQLAPCTPMGDMHLLMATLTEMAFPILNSFLHLPLIITSKSLWRSHNHHPVQLLSCSHNLAQLLEHPTNPLLCAPGILFPQWLPSRGAYSALNMPTVLVMKSILRMTSHRSAKVLVTLQSTSDIDWVTLPWDQT